MKKYKELLFGFGHKKVLRKEDGTKILLNSQGLSCMTTARAQSQKQEKEDKKSSAK